jgi:hypothetical protein
LLTLVLVLALTLGSGAVAPVARAQSLSVCNNFMAIQVDSTNGRFNQGAFPDPSSCGALTGSFNISFDWPGSPGTSFSTLRVDGQDYVYGSSGSVDSPPTNVDPSTNQSAWNVTPDIKVAQTLKIVSGPSTGNPDTALIEYEITNTGSTAHDVGLRVMIDDMLNGNDGAPFFIPGTGIVTTEKEFTGAAVPEYWQAFYSLSSSGSMSSQGTLSGGLATRPDRFVIASWPSIDGTNFDYTPTGQDVTSDSAVAAYWNPQTLQPGETLTFATLYGMSGFSQDLGPPLALSVTGPASLTRSSGGYSPNPFTVSADVQNISGATATAASMTLSVPPGLSLAPAETATHQLGDLQPGQTGSTSWQVVAAEQSSDLTETYTVAVDATNGYHKTVNRNILLRGGGSSLQVGTSAVTKFPGSPTSSGWPGERAFFEGTVTPAPGGAAATKWWFKYREVGGLLWIPTKPHPYTSPTIGEESSESWCSPGCSLPGLKPWTVYEVRTVAQEGSGPEVEGNTELFLPGGLINPTSFHPEGGWVLSFLCQSYCQALGGTGIGFGQFVVTSFQQQSTGGFSGAGVISETPGWDQNSGLFYGRMGVGLASLELNHPQPFPGSRQFPYFRFGGALDYSSSTGLLAIGGPIDNGSTVVGSWQACYQSQKCVVSAGSSKAVAGGLSIALGVVGVLATGPVGAAVDICGLVTGAISLDPPSPSYKHVSKPVRLRKIHVRAGKGVSVRSASALSMTGNAMIDTSTAGKAFLDAYQRYQGAVAAGSVQWMGRQLTATLNYGKAFVGQVRRAASVLTAQRSALLRSTMATKRLSRRQIARALQRARRGTLSPEVTKKLRQLGLSTTTIRAYLRRLPARPPAQTATALAPILNRTFAKELLGFATGLEQYLEKLQKEPLV